MISLDAISRPKLLASAAALGALALPIGRGLAATPLRDRTLRVSVDVGVGRDQAQPVPDPGELG
jgi:hypothetical protein